MKHQLPTTITNTAATTAPAHKALIALKRLLALLTILTSLIFVLPASVSQASAVPAGQVWIPSLNITRTIFTPSPDDVQGTLDRCIGATSLKLMPGVTWLAAHRTHCGSAGFGGVETLTNGAQVVVTMNGRTDNYTMIDSGIGLKYQPADPPPFGTDLVLQTSRDHDSVYLRFFAKNGATHAPDGRGRLMGNGDNMCVASGGREGEYALVNLTPTDSPGGGYGTLYPAGGSPGETSSVNWNGPTPEPNTALTKIGQDGKICVGTMGAPTHMVVDVLGISASNNFNWQAQRLMDTREEGGTIKNGTERCFTVPGKPGDWAVLNVTPIGITIGFGVIEAPGQQLSVSNVNYAIGKPNPNMTFAPIPESGILCYRSDGEAHVVIDLQATAPHDTISGSSYRLLDTRQDSHAARPHQCLSVMLSEKPVWMLVNLTSDRSVAPGYGRIYSSEQYPDPSSDVNYDYANDPNVSMVKVSPQNYFCVTSHGGAAEWIVDALAYTDGDTFREPARRRVLDTRL